jgi:hypothetical protein
MGVFQHVALIRVDNEDVTGRVRALGERGGEALERAGRRAAGIRINVEFVPTSEM